MSSRASEAMQKGRNQAGEQLRQVAETNGLDPQLMTMADNPYMSDGQRQVLGALIKQKMGGSGTKPTAAMQHYNLAKEQGFDGTFMDYQTQLAGASVPKQYGTIPPGHRLVQGNDGSVSYELIPGSPQARELEEAETKRVQREAGTDQAANIVLDEAAAIRETLSDPEAGPVTGIVGKMRSWFGENPANDVANRIGTIKANIGFKQLNDMRQSSPTGGA